MRKTVLAALFLTACGSSTPAPSVDAGPALPDGETLHCADAPATGWCPPPLECIRGYCGRFCNETMPCPDGERCAAGEDYCTPSL